MKKIKYAQAETYVPKFDLRVLSPQHHSLVPADGPVHPIDLEIKAPGVDGR